VQVFELTSVESVTVLQMLLLAILLAPAPPALADEPYYWGDYLGLDADSHSVVKVSRGPKIRFDVATGRRVH